MVILAQSFKSIFRNAPGATIFKELQRFNSWLVGDERVKRSKEVVLKSEPMGDLPAFQVIIAANQSLFQKVHVSACCSLHHKVVIPMEIQDFKVCRNRLLRARAELMIVP